MYLLSHHILSTVLDDTVKKKQNQIKKKSTNKTPHTNKRTMVGSASSGTNHLRLSSGFNTYKWCDLEQVTKPF